MKFGLVVCLTVFREKKCATKLSKTGKKTVFKIILFVLFVYLPDRKCFKNIR